MNKKTEKEDSQRTERFTKEVKRKTRPPIFIGSENPYYYDGHTWWGMYIGDLPIVRYCGEFVLQVGQGLYGSRKETPYGRYRPSGEHIGGKMSSLGIGTV